MGIRILLAATCFPLALSLTPEDYTRVNSGEAVVQLLPADSKEVAVFAATRITADPERLIRWTRRVDQLHKGRYVAAIGRFSDPPQLADLDALSLDDDDLTDLRRCRPGKCAVKLSDREIVKVRETIGRAGSDWKAAVQQTFREIVLARAERYLSEGHTASAYHDVRKPVLLDGEFAAVASAIAVTHPRLFPLTNYLSLYPRGEAADVESFLYWSKESLGGAKPIVSITHVAMIESRDRRIREAIVAKKQVYASHYILASLSFMAISTPTDAAHQYLVYLNLSRSDVFDGLFGGFIRRTIARRLRAEAPQVLQLLRARIETALPDEPFHPVSANE